MKMIAKLFALSLLVVGFGTANAASVTFNPSTGATTVGGTVTLDVWMDFTDHPTLGGGFDILYDPAILSVDSWSYAPLGDAFLQGPADFLTTPGVVSAVAVGDFFGLSGPALVGTVSFTAIAAGMDTVMMMDNLGPAGPFISAMDFFSVIPVNYGTASISVSTVPVPAAFWLFGTGLGLAGLLRRKTGVA